MPINRNALIRYRTIDNCLQNRRRKWTIDDLIDACNEALYKYDGTETDISLRTIRLDISALRSEALGYNAPIIIYDKKYYTYSHADFTITNNPITAQDLAILQEATKLLSQFKGFSHFNEMHEVVNKLEDKIYTEQTQQAPAIDFEKNELLTGIERLDELHKAIINKTTISLTYQSFKAQSANDIIFYPYLLKEYRNRWFILGLKKSDKQIITLALDRIKACTLLPKEKYIATTNFDAVNFYKDIIGVTKIVADKPSTISFWANSYHAPYIKTKPLHHSQKIVKEENNGTIFTIAVIPNYELERELLGFGEGIKVLAPMQLVKIMKKKIAKMYGHYFVEK